MSYMMEKEIKKTEPEDIGGVHMEGHILIRDITDDEEPVELVNKRNAIHYGNMAHFLAQCLAGKANYDIHYMGFGTGGSSVNALGTITYKTTNVSEAPDVTPVSGLHSLKYFKVVDDLAPGNNAPTKNKIEVTKSTTSYTDIKVTCTLDFGEPSIQKDFDNSTGSSDDTDFVFDELGLFSLDPSTGNEITGDATASATHTDFASKCYMLTHVIFHPVQKSLNRIIEVVYTLRIQMS